MRHMLFSTLLGLFLTSAAQADSSKIELNIRSQIEAFKADDFETAFSYASPAIREIFRTPENFGAMVRNGYPMVWRPSGIRFLELREIAGAWWQKIMITDAEGSVHTLDYQMVDLENGWKINAVQLLSSVAPSA